ncbi:MAG: excinuclease ABC subunit UvrC [Rickettsiales bacterium]|jgi:excinuclease UvrABC nuclease subunit|nr:excinuclease ABC subunit UvrC [Rickettsiales bacterium]
MIIQFNNLIEKSPKMPGVYLMYDAGGDLLYVGKAKNISARLKQYTDINKLEWHKRVMRSLVARVEWKITQTESDALVLEQELIKTLKPKYNIMMTDGKMYPMLELTRHEYPRLMKFRARVTNRTNVFGPYPSVGALNDTIKIIQRVCRIRTCTDTFFKNRTRPCLLHQIGRCSAPCMNGAGYSDQVKMARQILTGDAGVVAKELSNAMNAASKKMDYEAAAVFRDKLAALSATSARGRLLDIKQNIGFYENFDALEKWTGAKFDRGVVFDNSHLFGKNPVGAMIVFGRDGFIKSEYKKFRLNNKSAAGNDIAMMIEFITRAQKYAGNALYIVDGGRAQWNAAKQVLGDTAPILGVTKGDVRNGDEHFIMPDGTENFDLDKKSDLFLFLRRVRDEAHRFVITFHRARRGADAITSALDDIAGVGAARKRALLNHFGGTRGVADAHVRDLMRVPGISASVAEKIYNHFH